MIRIWRRIQTPLLVLLVILSLGQFAILITHSQEISRVVRQEESIKPQTATFDTTHLISPPRIYAHLPGGNKALLRTSSAYYQTIWNTVLKGSFSQLNFLRPEYLQVVEPETPLTEEVGMFLTLPSPIPLDQFCQAIDVEFASYEHQDLPTINRIFVSGEKNDWILLEDGLTGVLYKLPITSSAAAIYNLLQIVENSVYYSLTPIDLGPYDFLASNEIYTYTQAPYISTREVGKAKEWNLEIIASRFFDDITMVRSFKGASDTLVYYDGVKTLRQVENIYRYPVLEFKRGIDEETKGDKPLEALVTELNELQLWPSKGEYILDGLNCGETTKGYYNLVINGRPIFTMESGYTAGNTVKANSVDDNLTFLSVMEPAVGATGKQHLAYSAEYILWSLWNQLDWIWPEVELKEVVLRDIYEGYLFSQDQDKVDLVWVIEFYNGAKIFYNMLDGQYLGRLAPLLER